MPHPTSQLAPPLPRAQSEGASVARAQAAVVAIDSVTGHGTVIASSGQLAVGTVLTPLDLAATDLIALETIDGTRQPWFLLTEPGDNHPPADKLATNGRTSEPTRSRRALIIDDELANREYYSAACEQMGWVAEVAENAEVGRRKFEAVEPTVVLVDVRLPDTNGYDLCRQLRTTDQNQTFIALMSADPTMVEPQQAVAAGADLALVGPIGLTQLDTILSRQQARPVPPKSPVPVAPAATRFELRLFGEPMVSNGSDWSPLPPGGAVDILSILAINHPCVVSAAVLAELAWPADQGSVGAVYTAMSRLRTSLAERGCQDLLVKARHGYRLDVGTEAIDTVAFEHAVAELDSAELSNDEYIRRAQSILDQCDDTVYGTTELAALEAARVKISEARAVLEERIAVRKILVGDESGAISIVRRLAGREMWRESAWGILIVALYRSGRQREALETYNVTRNLLINSVGVDPCPALRSIENRVLNQDPILDDVEFVSSLCS